MRKIYAFIVGLLCILPAFGQSSGGLISPVKFGSYTGTIVGCTTAPTVNVLYTVIGKPTGGMVVVRFGTNACTSNNVAFQISGAPVAIRPISLDMTLGAVDGCGFIDNGVSLCGKVSVGMTTTGLLNFAINGAISNWTASGTKAIGVGTYAYPLQ